MSFNSEKNNNPEDVQKDEELREEEMVNEQEVEDLPKDVQEDAAEEQDELAQTKAALEQMNNKYLRLVAEFDNYRKRNAKERNELIKSAGSDVIKSLLDVLDDADRAEEQMNKDKDVKSVKKGAELIFEKLRSTLKAKGLKEMKSLGKEFDPELHDAITEIPVTKKKDKGKVMDVVQNGYYLNDRIIRHAKVVVGK